MSPSLLFLAHGAGVLAQQPQQALRASGVVPLASAQCPNDRWRDSCGVCGGDGASCTSLATVSRTEREFCIDNLLVRIHFIIVMIR